MKNKTVYMMIGPPCCGKSTWLRDMPKDVEVVSTDQYIEKMAEVEGSDYGSVFKKYIGEATKDMKRNLSRLIDSEQSFVWDQTNINKKSRSSKIKRLKDAGYTVIAIAFQVNNRDILKERNKKRFEEEKKHIDFSIISDFIDRFEEPTNEEGFDEIEIIKVE